MSDSNQTFLNILVIILLGAFLTTSATIADSMKQMKTNGVEPFTSTQLQSSDLINS